MAPTAAEPGLRLPILAARLRLRALSEGDIPALIELAGDVEVSRHTAAVPHPYGEADARAFLAQSARLFAAGGGVNLAVEPVDQPGLIGCVGVAVDGGKAEIGYWIGRRFWGRGFASEAVKAALPVIFEDLAADEASADVLSVNPASFRVLEKAGFVRAGAGAGRRGRCAGAPVVRYALRRDAWAARRAAPVPVVLVAAVALVDKDGRVLLAQRPAGKPMAGLWEFPGGKVRAGETPEAALIRELREELAIDVAERCLAPFTFASHRYDDFHLLMPLYVCRVWDGIVRPVEGQQLAWVRPARLAGYPMPPADRPLVAMLRDFL